MRSALFALVVSFSLATAAVADTEFEGSIPVDLVALFLGTPGVGETTIFSDLMDAFPTFPIPQSFEVLASIDRGYAISAYLQTPLAEEPALNLLAESFASAGFVRFELPIDDNADRGFVVASVSRVSRGSRYCHDALGFLSVSFADISGGNVATLSSSPLNNNRNCAEQMEEQQMHVNRLFSSRNNIRQYLPRMEMPEQKQRRGYSPFFGGGSSRSSGGIEVSSKVVSELTIDELFQHFETQIEAQDWEIDSQNIGSASASGSWIRSPEPGVNLIGTLSIILSSEDTYDLRFQLVSPGSNTGSSLGVFVN